MDVALRIVDEPGSTVRHGTIDVSRLPVLGEYIRDREDWYEVKRVVHTAGMDEGIAGEIYVIPVVDPAREPLRLSEWMASAP